MQITITETGEWHNARLTVDVTDMPALAGSPKQVEWAERIRRAAIVDSVMTKIGGDDLYVSKARRDYLMVRADKVRAALPHFIAVVEPITSASAWIDATPTGKGNGRTIDNLLSK